MTQVDFYTQVENKLLFACQITMKAVSKKLLVLLYAVDAGQAATLDSLLWTTPALSFIPHCAAGHRLAAKTPVIIGYEPHEFHHYQVLVNLQSEWPPFFGRFERLVEIVSTEETDKTAARQRWKFYKDRGYQLQNHDMSRR